MVYDAAGGDPAQGIAPGTPWVALPAYHYPTGGAPPAAFAAIFEHQLAGSS